MYRCLDQVIVDQRSVKTSEDPNDDVIKHGHPICSCMSDRNNSLLIRDYEIRVIVS